MKHSFVVHDSVSANYCVEAIRKLPLERRWQITIKEYKKNRTTEQNSRMWAILSDISEQIKDEEGKQYSPETWHEYFKAKFIGKDTIVIDDEIEFIAKTTTILNTIEFSDYCQQIEAWAVDHSVRFVDDRYEKC
ncbi:MAG: recombination protein NinB [Dehalococcoidales bacterium]|nr:recombination protein NinB [Dehalococcoidales bacterium]